MCGNSAANPRRAHRNNGDWSGDDDDEDNDNEDQKYGDYIKENSPKNETKKLRSKSVPVLDAKRSEIKNDLWRYAKQSSQSMSFSFSLSNNDCVRKQLAREVADE